MCQLHNSTIRIRGIHKYRCCFFLFVTSSIKKMESLRRINDANQLAELIHDPQYDLNGRFCGVSMLVQYMYNDIGIVKAALSWRGTIELDASNLQVVTCDGESIYSKTLPDHANHLGKYLVQSLLIEYKTNPDKVRKRMRSRFKPCCIHDAASVFCLNLLLQNAFFDTQK